MILLADAANSPLLAWHNFYSIIGSSAGALIGLQFVVIALIATTRTRANLESINAFGTPTIVHFGGALTVSAIMCAPWPSVYSISVALTLCGIGGVSYAVIVFRRASRQGMYKPVLEDWFWYVILPSADYAVLTLAAWLMQRSARTPLFVIGAASLALLFVGIHNAWDSVTHIVVTTAKDDQRTSQR